MNTLQSSKTTSEEVSEQLETSVQTEEKIDAAREVCTCVLCIPSCVSYHDRLCVSFIAVRKIRVSSKYWFVLQCRMYYSERSVHTHIYCIAEKICGIKFRDLVLEQTFCRINFTICVPVLCV